MQSAQPVKNKASLVDRDKGNRLGVGGACCCKGRRLGCSRLPWWLRGKSVCLRCGSRGFNPWVGKIPWRRKWQPTPVFLPGESHGSCLENPMDGGAWWITVHGVAKSRTRLSDFTSLWDARRPQVSVSSNYRMNLAH